MNVFSLRSYGTESWLAGTGTTDIKMGLPSRELTYPGSNQNGKENHHLQKSVGYDWL